VTRVQFLVEAAVELAEASAFLARKRRSLDAAFRIEVERAVEVLRGHPLIGPELSPGLRKLTLHRFPYHVLYRVSESGVLVTNVVHQRRGPDQWVDRE